jgi:hypothetical protein
VLHLLGKLYTFHKACLPHFHEAPIPLNNQMYCGCIPSRQNNLLGGAKSLTQVRYSNWAWELSFTSHRPLFPPNACPHLRVLYPTHNLRSRYVSGWVELKPLFQSRVKMGLEIFGKKFFFEKGIFCHKFSILKGKKGSPKI